MRAWGSCRFYVEELSVSISEGKNDKEYFKI